MVLALAEFMPTAIVAKQRIMNGFGEPSYGVDVSFPVHYRTVLDKHDPDQPLGDRQALYDEFMEGCYDYYGKRARSCDFTEDDRVAMSLHQPGSMQVRVSFAYQYIFFCRKKQILILFVVHFCSLYYYCTELYRHWI